MSWQTRKPTNFWQDELGMALPMAIIVLAVAATILVPIVSFLGTSLLSNMRVQDEEASYRAAEAGVEAVAADLVRGADALTSYTPPSVSLNDATVSISVSSPQTLGLPTPTPVIQYFDPGLRHPHLKTVPPKMGYIVVLYNVITGTMQANWAYSPNASTRVGVWDIDLQTEGYPVGQINEFPTRVQPILDTGRTSAQAVFNQTGSIPTVPGTYSIVFYNNSASATINSNGFTPNQGAYNTTWVRAIAYKDYYITSAAGNYSIDAYLRQTPGITMPPTGTWSTTNPSWITNTVTIEAWKRD